MSKVVMYTTGNCPYCSRAEMLLTQRGVTEIEKIRIDVDAEQRTLMMERTGRRTVPQANLPRDVLCFYRRHTP